MSDLLLVAVIAGERVAFRAADIQSVVEIDAITPVPCVPDFVAGLAALRSRPLTVIDCTRSLELPAPEDAEGRAVRKAVVVEADRHLYALLVDAIEDVVSAGSEISPPPGKLAPNWERASFGLVESVAGTLLLADPAALIAGPARRQAA